jgi:hypothetical protein
VLEGDASSLKTENGKRKRGRVAAVTRVQFRDSRFVGVSTFANVSSIAFSEGGGYGRQVALSRFRRIVSPGFRLPARFKYCGRTAKVT